MTQMTLSDIEYSRRRKKARREQFLDAMEEIIPWEEYSGMIQPVYPQGKRGRRPIGVETMLRMYLLQKWFSLGAEALEEAVYDSYAMRTFMHIDFFRQQVPDSTTLLRFRHLIDKHGLSERISADLEARLKERGLVMHTGSISEPALSTLTAK